MWKSWLFGIALAGCEGRYAGGWTGTCTGLVDPFGTEYAVDYELNIVDRNNPIRVTGGAFDVIRGTGVARWDGVVEEGDLSGTVTDDALAFDLQREDEGLVQTDNPYPQFDFQAVATSDQMSGACGVSDPEINLHGGVLELQRSDR